MELERDTLLKMMELPRVDIEVEVEEKCVIYCRVTSYQYSVIYTVQFTRFLTSFHEIQ